MPFFYLLSARYWDVRSKFCCVARQTCQEAWFVWCILFLSVFWQGIINAIALFVYSVADSATNPLRGSDVTTPSPLWERLSRPLGSSWPSQRPSQWRGQQHLLPARGQRKQPSRTPPTPGHPFPPAHPSDHRRHVGQQRPRRQALWSPFVCHGTCCEGRTCIQGGWLGGEIRIQITCISILLTLPDCFIWSPLFFSLLIFSFIMQMRNSEQWAELSPSPWLCQVCCGQEIKGVSLLFETRWMAFWRISSRNEKSMNCCFTLHAV